MNDYYSCIMMMITVPCCWHSVVFLLFSCALCVYALRCNKKVMIFSAARKYRQSFVFVMCDFLTRKD